MADITELKIKARLTALETVVAGLASHLPPIVAADLDEWLADAAKRYPEEALAHPEFGEGLTGEEREILARETGGQLENLRTLMFEREDEDSTS